MITIAAIIWAFWLFLKIFARCVSYGLIIIGLLIAGLIVYLGHEVFLGGANPTAIVAYLFEGMLGLSAAFFSVVLGTLILYITGPVHLPFPKESLQEEEEPEKECSDAKT